MLSNKLVGRQVQSTVSHLYHSLTYTRLLQYRASHRVYAHKIRRKCSVWHCKDLPCQSSQAQLFSHTSHERLSSYTANRASTESEGVNVHTDHINRNIIYSDDHIVAVNKPSGQSVYGSTNTEADRGNQTLTEALPELCAALQVPDLQVGLSLKSFYSGLTLLCKSNESKTRLDKSLKEAAASKKHIYTYLVVTVGVPKCPLGTNLSSFIRRDFIHDREMSVVEDKTNSNARKSGSMVTASFCMRDVAYNEDLGVALMEVSINKDKWEMVEALMSHYLSPVLGDKLYSCRTQYVMGVPFRASPHSVRPSKQRLSDKLRQALEDCNFNHTDRLGEFPLFMHRHKITLDKFPGRKALELTAPPPEYFISMLKRLGLYVDKILER